MCKLSIRIVRLSHYFGTVLRPDDNQPHENHFHLDISTFRVSRWFSLVHQTLPVQRQIWSPIAGIDRRSPLYDSHHITNII
ncbi:extensin family protein [Marinobacter segnicrescens]|uniref:extensin family protein n=1 Tax=Marinobacter segnicrescens TaxID=430453 RepID=UPI0015A6415E